MLSLILEEIAAKGIWQLIKEAAKALWKGVIKRPPSENTSNTMKMTPPGKKPSKRQRSGEKKSLIFKIEIEKKIS